MIYLHDLTIPATMQIALIERRSALLQDPQRYEADSASVKQFTILLRCTESQVSVSDRGPQSNNCPAPFRPSIPIIVCMADGSNMASRLPALARLISNCLDHGFFHRTRGPRYHGGLQRACRWP